MKQLSGQETQVSILREDTLILEVSVPNTGIKTCETKLTEVKEQQTSPLSRVRRLGRLHGQGSGKDTADLKGTVRPWV